MVFEETRFGDVLVAKVAERRIAAEVAHQLKEALADVVKKGNRRIVLDLSDVTFIDSGGLGALISSLKAVGGDGELVLAGSCDAVVNMFKLTRMNKVFRMFDTPDQAVAALQ